MLKRGYNVAMIILEAGLEAEVTTEPVLQGDSLSFVVDDVRRLAELVRETHGPDQESPLTELEIRLTDIDERIKRASGSLAIGLPRPPRFNDIYTLLAEDFEVPTEDRSRLNLQVPVAQITNYRTNPRYYGTGENTSPALELRIITSQDKPFGDNLRPFGRWLCLPLEKIELELV